MRLDKFLSSAGCGSRSEVKAAIAAGRVRVDGAAALRPEQQLDPDTVCVTYDGAAVGYKQYRIIMLNKPAGYLSTRERGGNVFDLLPERWRHLNLSAAGRLDRDAEGLLLLTDDGGLLHQIISPSRQVPKLYYVQTDRPLPSDAVKRVADGLEISGGERTRPGVLSVEQDGFSAYLEICEGKFHQVKRMISSLGGTVVYLRRLRIGPVVLDGSLPLGGSRELTAEEENALRAATNV